MNNIKILILEFLTNRKAVTFAELEELFINNRIDFKGYYDYSAGGDYGRILYWSGWKREIIELIIYLKNQRFIELSPIHPISYIIEGSYLNIPIVEKIYPYKTDHWLPVTIDITPKGEKYLSK